MNDTTRQQRIEMAQTQLELLEPMWKEINAKYSDAMTTLNKAKASFDIGEWVMVKEYCKRGCCLESSFEGEVVSMTDNGSYNVQTEAGLRTYIWGGEMKRKEWPTK